MAGSENTKIWDQWQACSAYRNAMGFTSDFPMYEDFKEGKQWPAATERTKNLPRPVFNIVDMFIRTKTAAVINQPITINYTPAEVSSDAYNKELADQGAKDFTDYAKQLWDDIDQDGLNEDFIEDAATLGTGILHYYYDSSVTGGIDTKYVGEIRGETIDPLNIGFSDPQNRDVQKQRYIIIAQRRPVEEIREMAKAEGVSPALIERITADNNTSAEGYAAAQNEVKGEDKLTLLTKYYRKNGVVYFDKATECVEIIKERCLTPVGGEDESSPADNSYRIRLYPIEVMSWYKRKKCIYGIGECQTIIPGQKAVNFLKAMELLSVQQTAWPKILARPNALKQAVTNEPGEILTDWSGQPGAGITYMNPPAMTAAATNLAATIFDLLRTTAGVSEVSTGEPIGSNIAASAIIALQSQARTPIEKIQKRYWKSVRRVGAIWAELIKAYYNIERSITVEDFAADDADLAADDLNAPEMTAADVIQKGLQSRPFTGSIYAGIDFKLKIDVGASSEYGEVLAQSTLDNMLARGDISIDEYVDLAPHNVVPFKETFKRLRKKNGKAAQELLNRALMEQQAAMMTPDMAASDGAPVINPTGAEGTPLPTIPEAPGM